MSDLNNADDFGDTTGFYPRRREGLGNFFIGVLTGIAVVVGVLLLIIGIWGPGALPLPFLASRTPVPSATSETTLTLPPSITFTPTEETPSVTPTPSCPAEYVVQSGDNLETIAKKCGISVEAIVGMNGGLDPFALQVGQTLKLPPAGTGFTPTAIPSNQPIGSIIPIVVLAGDNLEIIAARCLSTTADLIKRNKIEDPNFLTVGMILQCRYGIATPVPVRISPTYGFTPTFTLTPSRNP